MERGEFGVAFLYDEGAERKTEGYVVEGVGFGVVGEDGTGDGELEGWGHSCALVGSKCDPGRPGS